jgi:outer membrane lipoprotein-sorting protein
MTHGKWLLGLAVAGGSLAVATSLLAQAPQAPAGSGLPGRDQLPRPVYRVSQLPDNQPRVAANNNLPASPSVPAATPTPEAPTPSPTEHPLEPALRMAHSAIKNINANIKDYSAVMVKRENVGGRLNEQEFMYIKIRHQPFSVYMYFLGPEKLRGQEAIYVEGQNNGNLLGHGVGIKKIAGTVPLQPTGALAMAGQRYPITEIGFLNLTKRLIEVADMDKQYGECDVKFYQGAKINKRSSTCIQVEHPVPRKNFRFHKALVFVDDELNIPVRYEAYDWPATQGGQPVLLEEYTYTDIKINNGFTDADFSEHNPNYHFH